MINQEKEIQETFSGAITIDENVNLKIHTKKELNIKIQSMITKNQVGLYSNFDPCYNVGTYVQEDSDYYITTDEVFNYDMLHLSDYQAKEYGSNYNPHYYVTIEYGRQKLNGEYNKVEFEVYVRRNKVAFNPNEKNKMQDTEMNKKYVRTNSTVQFETQFGFQDEQECGYLTSRSIGRFSIEGDATASRGLSNISGKGFLETTSIPGKSAAITWQNDAGTKSVPLNFVTSNFVNPYTEGIQGDPNGKSKANNIPISEVWQSTGNINFKRTIYVEKGKNSKVYVKFRGLDNGSGSIAAPDMDALGFNLEDKTGCLNNNSFVYTSDNKVELEINAKDDFGWIQASWKDYRNNTITENWKVMCLKESELAQQEDVQNQQDIQLGDEQKNSVTNTIGDMDNYDGNGGQGFASGGSNFFQASYDDSQPQSSEPPQIDITATRIDVGRVHFDVVTSGATSAMYQIWKRNGTDYDNLEEFCHYPSSNYEANGGYSASNPQSYSFDIVAGDDQGFFDVVAIAANAQGVTNWVASGPHRIYVAPTIDCSASRVDDSSVKVTFHTENATQSKVYVRKRNMINGELEEFKEIPYNYSQVKGTFPDTKQTDYAVHINAGQFGKGYFDVIGIVKNTHDDVMDYVAIGPIYVNAPPKAFINTTNISSSSEKVLKPSYYDEEKSTCNFYYYIRKKDAPGEYVEPSNETIINYGKLNNEENEITLSASNAQNGTGYYDVTVLALDSDGAYGKAYLSDIPISKAPKATYTIEGEEGNSSEGYVAALNKRNTQKLLVTIEDEDMNDEIINDEVTVNYFVTSENLNNEEIFASRENFLAASQVQYQNVKCNATNANFEITIQPDENVLTEKYVYMMLEDKFGGASYYKAGSFIVDDTQLKLEGIAVTESEDDENYTENEKKVYKIGDEMRVMFQFNHTMKSQAPDLYLKFGNTERKQDRIEYKDNDVFYVYVITAEDESGAVQLSRLDYANNCFEDTYLRKNQYQKSMNMAAQSNDRMGDGSNVKDCIVNNNYTIDTTTPQIDSIEINLATDESVTRIDDNENNRILLSNIKGGNITVNYSEDVVGVPLNIDLLVGNNYTYKITAQNDTKRSNDVYSLDDIVNLSNKYEGSIDIEKISDVITLTDEAGNKLNNKEYTVVYKINGTTISNKKIIIDKYVSDTKFTNKIFDDANTTNINTRSIVADNDCFNINTVVNCFSEYSNANSQDYKDEAGIDKINIRIYNDISIVRLMDKNRRVLLKANQETGNTQYPGVTEFDLTEEELPLSLELKEAGKYKVVAIKEDKLGNRSETIKEFTVSDDVTIDAERSGFTSLNNDTLYNVNELSNANMEYEIYVQNNSEVSGENLDVAVSGGITGENIATQFARSVTIEEQKYDVFKTTIEYGGIYSVVVSDKNTNKNLLTKELVVDNLYVPGDTNNDGAVDAVDVTILLKYIVGSLNNRYLVEAGDVNHNGSVDVVDGVILCRYVAKDTKVRSNNSGYLEIVD